jgi:cysteine desulfurase
MTPASDAVLALLAAHGAPQARSSLDGPRAAWTPADWLAHLSEVQSELVPQLPPRIRTMLGGSVDQLRADILRGTPSAPDLARHALLEDGSVRLLLVDEPATSAPIYLDNNASTQVDPRVAAAVGDGMVGTFANPHSADHVFGTDAKAAVEGARVKVAELAGAKPGEVHFTSGATESIKLGIDHAVRSLASARGRRPHVVVLPCEHRAVLAAVEAAVKLGQATAEYLDVDEQGRITTRSLADALLRRPDLIVCMGANNEIGNVYPISALASYARGVGAKLFVDGTQWVGKEPMHAADDGIDVLVFSAHKIYGPKGVGAIVVRGDLAPGFEPPGGTPATPVIVGLGEAAHLRRFEQSADGARVAALRDRLADKLLGAGLGIVRNGDPASSLAGTLHVSVPNLQSELLLAWLRERVALSTGAACASAKGANSHVLAAMRLPPWRRRGAVRIGLGKFNTQAEIDDAGAQIIDGIRRLRGGA